MYSNGYTDVYFTGMMTLKTVPNFNFFLGGAMIKILYFRFFFFNYNNKKKPNPVNTVEISIVFLT